MVDKRNHATWTRRLRNVTKALDGDVDPDDDPWRWSESKQAQLNGRNPAAERRAWSDLVAWIAADYSDDAIPHNRPGLKRTEHLSRPMSMIHAARDLLARDVVRTLIDERKKPADLTSREMADAVRVLEWTHLPENKPVPDFLGTERKTDAERELEERLAAALDPLLLDDLPPAWRKLSRQVDRLLARRLDLPHFKFTGDPPPGPPPDPTLI